MKHPILLAALLSLLVTTACNSSDNDAPEWGTYPESATYATTRIVENLEDEDQDEYYFEMGSGIKLFLTDNAMSSDYDFVEGERVVIYYTVLEDYSDQDSADKKQGSLYDCDYGMRLFNLFTVKTSQSIVISNDDENEAVANHSISYIYGGNYLSIGYGYINMVAALKAEDHDDSKLYLAKNLADMPDDDDIKEEYLYLDLRYDRGTAESTGTTLEQYVSLSLEDFEEELAGKEGVMLRLRTLNSGTFYVELTFSEDERRLVTSASRSAGSML
ncbi:MAG: NigD-like C-terminal domain-containing protein [Rikenellaceae bacterium]